MTEDINADDERRLAAFMTTLAGAPLPVDGRLDAGLAWQKAQLTQRWRAERRAHAALEALETIYLALGTAAAGLFLMWSQPSLERLFTLIRP